MPPLVHIYLVSYHSHRPGKCMVPLSSQFEYPKPHSKVYGAQKISSRSPLSLVHVQKRRAGRPALDALAPPPKKAAVQSSPSQDMQFDGFNHLPACTEKRQRCKYCKEGFSFIKCEKCNVWLCLRKGKNCFQDFHSR